MVLDALKKAGGDFWDEMLYMIAFNIIWVIGAVLILPLPYVTFGMFYIMYDVGQGKGITVKAFFQYANQTWRQAYIWGVINLVIVGVLLFNLSFYIGLETQLGTFMLALVFGLIILWMYLQLVMLALYPRLETPSFNMAIRNAIVIIGRYPGAILSLVTLIFIFGIIVRLFPGIMLFVGMTFIAILVNHVVDEGVKRELKRHDDGR